MNIKDIISSKARNRELTDEEIRFFVDGVVNDTIEDYQITALLSAIYINGLLPRELSCLTSLMAETGKVLELDEFEYTLDKHSSGGVGDKVTLIVTPVIACFGITVPKMSGRGLSYTGGTIDKLESIPGFNVNLPEERFFEILRSEGCAITSQTGNMCYADKRLYALRDVTGLTDSIPLIASSIMSKKIASGAKNIILDVKCGSGAFMKSEADAVSLSETMVSIGKNLDRNVVALITDMNEPLGYKIGNSLEVIEAVEVLSGKYVLGLSELCETVCAYALIMCKKENDFKKACAEVREVIKSGRALNKFRAFVEKQNGDAEFINDLKKLPLETAIMAYSPCSGYIAGIDSEEIGRFVMKLGGGRTVKEDNINYGVGINLLKKTGAEINKGEALAEIYIMGEYTEEIQNEFLHCFEFSDEKPEINNIIIKTIGEI